MVIFSWISDIAVSMLLLVYVVLADLNAYLEALWFFKSKDDFLGLGSLWLLLSRSLCRWLLLWCSRLSLGREVSLELKELLLISLIWLIVSLIRSKFSWTKFLFLWRNAPYCTSLKISYETDSKLNLTSLVKENILSLSLLWITINTWELQCLKTCSALRKSPLFLT